MPEYYAPGVHIEREGRGERYLEIIRTDGAVFLGLTECGPIGKPIRVSSFNEFRQIFGNFIPSSFLPYAIYGFFLNGGRECHIVRVAHVFRRKNEEILCAAAGEIKSVSGEASFKIEARSGGVWGNRISPEIRPAEIKVKTFSLSEVTPSSEQLKVANSRKFEKGDLVSIKSSGRQDYFEVVSIQGAHLFFAQGSLKSSHNPGEQTEIAPVRFDLKIACGEQKEEHKNLSPGRNSRRYWIDYIGKHSRLLHILPSDKEGLVFPKPGKCRLKGGKDGIGDIIPDDYIGLSGLGEDRIGLASLEGLEEGRIIALPDLHVHQSESSFGAKGVKAVLRAALDLVENSRYRFLLVDPPPGLNIKEVQSWREEIDSSYAALIYPWLKAKVYQSDQMLPIRIVPPSGYVAGIMARSDVKDGTHHSFANQELEGIVDTEIHLTQSDTELLNQDGINAVLAFPSRGIRAWGARTLSSDAAYRYINVRRTFNMIAESIEQGTQWVAFEPNAPELWQSIKRVVYFFLKDLWKRGYLQGENTEEAFYIKVDEENNPPEVRDNGQLIIEVGVAIVRPAEFIIIRIAQKTMETQEE